MENTNSKNFTITDSDMVKMSDLAEETQNTLIKYFRLAEIQKFNNPKTEIWQKAENQLTAVMMRLQDLNAPHPDQIIWG